MLSSSSTGQTSKVYKEYLGEGGVMELRSNQPQKKMISCVSHDEMWQQQIWSFDALAHDDIEADFFNEVESNVSLTYGDILSWCVGVLQCSPSANLMIKEASTMGWSVTVDDLQGGDYCIDVDQKVLILDNNALVPSALARSNYFRNVTLVTLTKAMRDIWQEKRHGGFDEIYSPENIILMERTRAADLDVLAVLAAWELRSEGYGDVWRHVIGSELGDMAMCFSGHLERDPSAQFNGLALRAMFKQWFREEKRVNACDHDALEYMDDVIACADSINPFGKKKPTKMNIEMLSCLPDRTAYLQGLGAEITSDPLYAAVNDEINQIHLLHIVHDTEAVIVENVPFRDVDLARKIFPAE